MARRPEVGNVALYPDRPLTKKDKNGYVLKFYCPIQGKRIRRNCGTRDRREARKILRECRERLLNGDYVESNGAITGEISVSADRRTQPSDESEIDPGPTWEECYDKYRDHQKKRVRPRTYNDTAIRLGTTQRIFEKHANALQLSGALYVREVLVVDKLEYLQDRLLDGDLGRYASRSPNTVNSTLASVMAFARFCHRRGWIHRVPPVQKLQSDEVMKGRPITEAEYQLMLDAVPKVVGDGPAESWRFALRVIWESGFRVGELMNFSWDDLRCIHPVWPTDGRSLPTLLVPLSQKNKRVQETPLLPSLGKLLQTVPKEDRTGWIVDPKPIQRGLQPGPFRPSRPELERLIEDYSDLAIADACKVTSTTVKNWLVEDAIDVSKRSRQVGARLSLREIAELRVKGSHAGDHPSLRTPLPRLTTERVSVVISQIGEAAGVVVKEAASNARESVKFASAHDLRRSCAVRLVNAGASAETLKVVLRHASFSTTEQYYGASRSAQSAAAELQQCFAKAEKTTLVGGLMGGGEPSSPLSDEERLVLKSLLSRL